jgi:hypothetical protein
MPEPKWEVGFEHNLVPLGGRFHDGRFIKHSRSYSYRPSNVDVYAFMDEFWWKLRETGEGKVLKGAICKDAWLEAIGESPTRSFAAP